MFPDIEQHTPGALRSASKGFCVADLANGDKVTGFIATTRAEKRMTRGNKPYLSLLLTDRTGQIDGRDWDNAEVHEPVFQPGTVVKVQARVEEFSGELQLIIEKARKAADNEYEQSDFLPATRFDIEQMYAALGEIVSRTQDPFIRPLLESLLCRHAAAWRTSPAAMKYHHAFVGGLLEHVLSMCRAAEALATHYTRLNRDVLIAGCMLHDIGKMRELETGLAINTSIAGKLVGHIAEGLLMLEEACREVEGFPDETRLVLRHMIVSHHGHYEYGALKLPATPEALALHAIDDLDWRLERAFALIDAPGDAAFSPYERSMEREIYRVR